MGIIGKRLECCRRSKYPVDLQPRFSWTRGQVPESRIQLSQFYGPEGSEAKGRRMTAQHGNILENTWLFDNGVFNVSTREANP